MLKWIQSNNPELPPDELHVIETGLYGRREVIGHRRAFCELEQVDAGPNAQKDRIVFITLVSGGGVKPEGSILPAYFVSREAAEDALVVAIHNYIRPRGGLIHWRQTPIAYSVMHYTLSFPDGIGTPILVPKELWVSTCRLALHPFCPGE